MTLNLNKKYAIEIVIFENFELDVYFENQRKSYFCMGSTIDAPPFFSTLADCLKV
jgi:hypothetical protein